MDNGKGQLATGSMYLSIDSILAAGIGGVFWVVVGKLAPPGTVGQANIVVALAGLLMTFAGLGFNIGASKFIAEHNSRREYAESRRVYSKTLEVTIASSVVLMIGLVVAASYAAQVTLGGSNLAFLVVIGALTLPFQAIFKTLYGVYQGAHRMAYCLIIDAIFLSLRLGLSVALLLAGYGTLGILLGFAAGYLASTLFGMGVLARRAIPRVREVSSVSSDSFKRLFDFSMPNYVAGIFLIASIQIPIILLGVYRGSASAAFFNIAVLTKSIVVAISGSIGLALLPTVAGNISRGSDDSISSLYNLSIRSSILLASAPALVFMLAPSAALSLISSEYATNASSALQILMVSAIGTVILGTCTQMMNSIGRPMTALYVTAASSVVGLVACVVTIPLWGVDGAAAASVVSGVAGAILGVTFLSWRGHLKTELAALAAPLIAVTLAASVGEVVVVRGLSPFLAVGVSLLVLLTLSLILKALTVTEISSMVKLAIQTVSPIISWTRRESDIPLRNVAAEEEQNPTVS
jgi:stage V sporulation protein B